MPPRTPSRTDPLLRSWVPYIILTVSLLLTAAAAHYVHAILHARDSLRFQNAVYHVEEGIRDRMELYVAALRGGAGLFAAAGDVTSAQFHTYVERLELPSTLPGVQGVGYAARIPRTEKSAHEQRRRAAGAPAFRLWPESDQAEFHSILYLEPLDPRNRRALGYDMSADPTRRAAMERARDEGAARASGKVTLVQEAGADRQAGFLVYVPVYHAGWPIETVAQRRRALRGFVYSPFRAGDLFSRVFRDQAESVVDFAVYDGPAKGQLLFNSEEPERPPSRTGLARSETLTVAGRPWTLEFSARPEFDAQTDQQIGPLVMLIGVLFSLLLFVVTWAQAAARRTAEAATAELRQSEDALRQANTAKDEFLAMLGHELRNPLGAISNALEIMRARGINDPALSRAREIVVRQVRHQTRLIEDLLDVSRVTSGKIGLQRQLVNLSEVVESSAQGLRWAAEEQGHQVTLSLPATPVLVEGDPVRLEQVVTNLLHNALKYTPHGGRVTVSLAAGGDQAVLRVRDNGVGIAPEMLSTVFETFAQAAASIDRSKGGLGLGLTLVRSLVQMHGGTVTAASAGPGQGSEFTVVLPLAEQPAAAPPPEAAAPTAPTPPSGTRRVLVIEDNDDARETLRDVLELWGHEVEVAADGSLGLDLALSLHPEIALVDIGLPGLDGYEVARRVRAAEDGASMRMIALTGYGQPEDRRRALEAGFDSHLVKPVDLEMLSTLLRER